MKKVLALMLVCILFLTTSCSTSNKIKEFSYDGKISFTSTFKDVMNAYPDAQYDGETQIVIRNQKIFDVYDGSIVCIQGGSGDNNSVNNYVSSIALFLSSQSIYNNDENTHASYESLVKAVNEKYKTDPYDSFETDTGYMSTYWLVYGGMRITVHAVTGTQNNSISVQYQLCDSKTGDVVIENEAIETYRSNLGLPTDPPAPTDSPVPTANLSGI